MTPTKSVLCVVVLLLATACSTLLWETGLPWAQAEFRVTGVERRAGFLEVEVQSSGITRRYFSRATATCQALLQRDTVVTLTRSDGLGPFERDGQKCPIAGIGDLEKLRSSRSRGRGYGQSPIRRGNDRIEIVHRDEVYLYARGGFSIAAMFGWAPGTDQVVALLPLTAECAPLADGGYVGLLFREVGSPALGIVAGEQLCPVHGLIAVGPDDFATAE